MNSKRLVELYLESLGPGTPTLDDDDYPALLFGTDEFKINRRRQTIKIPGLGTVSYAGPVKERPEWVALVRDSDGWSALFGSGNPYEHINGDFPMKNGRVIALPNAVYLATVEAAQAPNPGM